VNRKQAVIFLGMSLMCTGLLMMVPVKALAVDYRAAGSTAETGNEGCPVESYGSPNLNLQPSQWEILQIKAPEAWPIVSGGKCVPVAVLDTGIDASLDQLKGKVVQEISYTSDRCIDTLNGHGTAIAGIIAGTMGNSSLTGIACNCSLMDVQVAENDGSTDADKVAQGIAWAANHGARIINVSIVINKPWPSLEYAVAYAWSHGCVILAAAGNTCSSDPVYPAAYPHVIGVAASDKKDNLVRWSNHGDWVSVAAPGVDIYSALPENRFGYKSGSSFSSALVAGEAALLYSGMADFNDNGRVNDEVADIIMNSGDGLTTQDSAVKRINVYKAARAANLQSEASGDFD
jgi:thermitase